MKDLRDTALPAAEAHVDALALVSELHIAAQLAGSRESARAVKRRFAAELLRLTGTTGLTDLLRPALSDVDPALSFELAGVERAEEPRSTIIRLCQRENLMDTRITFLPRANGCRYSH